jgi:endoribonuclease Dicer
MLPWQSTSLTSLKVNSVTLVFQQYAVLKANLDQPMHMLCGDMGTDNFSREPWEKHFSKNMVIVCTAEILRQCLTHGFISMNRINLLIFDEAHHAKKDHSYARIIKDFYCRPSPGTELPKIFGMTASPVDARVDVKKAARELEGLLHCQIATAADRSLGAYRISSQQELLLKYSSLGPEFKTPLHLQMLEKLEKNVVFHKPLLFSRAASKELGSWCSDQVWPFCFGEDETKTLLAKTERQYHMTKVREPLDVLEKRKILVEQARDIVKSHQFESPHYDPQSDRSRNLSSKVVQLIRCLRGRYERPTDDKAIVFVKQRYTARLLARLFSYPNVGTPHLKVGILVRIPFLSLRSPQL